jgi:hypothetical protein
MPDARCNLEPLESMPRKYEIKRFAIIALKTLTVKKFQLRDEWRAAVMDAFGRGDDINDAAAGSEAMKL